jgi:hypothetical protein
MNKINQLFKVDAFVDGDCVTTIYVYALTAGDARLKAALYENGLDEQAVEYKATETIVNDLGIVTHD